MSLIALVLTSLALAGDRSDADRAEGHDRSERSERSESAERAESGERASAERSRSSTAERAHHDRGARRHHVRAGGHRAVRYAPAHRHRAHYVHAPRTHTRVVVHAAPPREERAPARVRRPAEPEHNVAVTVNVLDVPAPLFSAGVEVALGRNVGLMGTGGIGFASTGTLYEVGGDVRAYFVGDFDKGIYVGGGIGATNLTPFAMGESATTFDGFVGAKYTLPFGMTGDVSVGLEAAAHEQIGGLYPTAKLGLGWAF